MRSISGQTVEGQARRIRALMARAARRRSLRDPIAASCEDLDLTRVQIHILLSLGQDGGATMGELARRVAVTEKTITGIVDRLERDALVARERAAADRRVVTVRLAPRGAALARRIDAEIQAKIVGLLGLLDAHDRKELVRILEKVETRLGELVEEARR